MRRNLETLADVSRRLGAQAGYIQGGGGNTSLKFGAGVLSIKASGIALATVDAETGFIALDGPVLRDGLRACRDESDYGRLLQGCVLDGAERRRPSIESGFHALLGTCVIHTHSVWINLLTCSREGRDLARKILPEASWVPYATPGLALTEAVRDTIGAEMPAVILLESHGVVISGPDPVAGFALHEEVNRRVIDHFGCDLPFPAPDSQADEAEGQLLFPDQAIYTCDPELMASQAGVETRQAVAFLLATQRRLGLTPQFLDAQERDKLLNLESEKYRQKLVRA